jgi:hypothetical protein
MLSWAPVPLLLLAPGSLKPSLRPGGGASDCFGGGRCGACCLGADGAAAGRIARSLATADCSGQRQAVRVIKVMAEVTCGMCDRQGAKCRRM